MSPTLISQNMAVLGGGGGGGAHTHHGLVLGEIWVSKMGKISVNDQGFSEKTG
jgi:hypothetical protein